MLLSQSSDSKRKLPNQRAHRMIVLAVYALLIAHPGPIFGDSDAGYGSDAMAASDGYNEKADPGMETTERSV